MNGLTSPLKRISSFLLIMAFFALSGCLEDKFDFNRLSTDMEISPSFSAPLAKGSITLEDLVDNDSENIVYDSSDAQGPFLKFVYREDSIFSYSGSDFFGVNESGSDSYTLGSIDLEDFGPIQDTVTLGQIVRNASNHYAEATLIEDADGSSILVPEITEEDSMAISGEYEAEEIDNFRYAILESGQVELQITNDLPADVTVEFLFKTKVMDPSGTFIEEDLTVEKDEFSNLASKTSQTKTIDLAGQKLGSILYITELAISTPGTTSPVNIDLDGQYLRMKANATNLVLSEGEVRIPDQSLNNQTTQVGTGYAGDKRLDTIRLAGGQISYSIENNTNVSATLEFVLPSTMDLSTGNPLTITKELQPRTTLESRLDLANTETILNGADSVPIQYNLQLDPTQDFVEYHSSDQVNFSYNIDLDGEDAEYISGFFGQETIDFPSQEIETGLDLFERFTGAFTLTSPSIRLFYENSIGIPFTANLQLLAEAGSEQLDLGEGGNDGLLDFNHPLDPETVLNDTLLIDKNNSDIDQFISLPPERILFDGEGYINYNKSSSTYNYLTSHTTVQVGMEMDLPMELKTQGMTYRDSFAFEVDVDFDEAVNLFGKFTNEFPFSIDLQVICRDSTTNQDLLQLEALDENGNPVQVLDAPQINASGRIDAPSKNLVYFRINESEMDQLKQTNQLVIVASVATSGNEGVKFYTDYTLDFRIGIDETGTTLDL